MGHALGNVADGRVFSQVKADARGYGIGVMASVTVEILLPRRRFFCLYGLQRQDVALRLYAPFLKLHLISV